MKNNKFLSFAALTLGVLLCLAAFSITPLNDDSKFLWVNVVLLIVGALIIYISFKLNPQRVQEIIEEDEEYEPEPEKVKEHNYSPDFEMLYNKTIEWKADRLIESFEVLK